MTGKGDVQEHRYGPRVHLTGDPWSLTALARLSSPDVSHTELLALLRSLYRGLAQRALGRELPTVEASVPTRMAAVHRSEGVFRGQVLDRPPLGGVEFPRTLVQGRYALRPESQAEPRTLRNR